MNFRKSSSSAVRSEEFDSSNDDKIDEDRTGNTVPGY